MALARNNFFPPAAGRRFVWLGILSILFGSASAIAQPQDSMAAGRLTVRPLTMATGTRNARAGWQPVDSAHPRDRIYVPSQCVGPRRCPLVLHLGEPRMVPPVADRYGIIGLRPARVQLLRGSVDPNDPFLLRDLNPAGKEAVRQIDTVLHLVLQNFAIDPGKIAVVGNSNYGAQAGVLGRTNPDVFSRIAPFQVSHTRRGAGPRDTTTQLFTDVRSIALALQRWREGQHVKPVFFFMPHIHSARNYHHAWRWFHESWMALPPPPVDPDSLAAALPRLTPAILDTMVDFWERWTKAPWPIRKASLDHHRWKEVPLLIGRRVGAVLMPDMVALAAEYPWVAEALKASGLTAQRWETYRATLTSAHATVKALNARAVTKDPSLALPPVDPNTTLGRNIVAYLADSARVKPMVGSSP